MTVTPDPKAVREIARRAVHEAIIGGKHIAVNGAIIANGVPGPVTDGTFEAYRNAVGIEYDRLATTLPWSAEPPQSAQDGYAVRLLDMLEADPNRFQESEEDDLRAALSNLARYGAEATNLATMLNDVYRERGAGVQAVAEAVSILEGMLNEDAWAYDAGRARNVLLDCFARELDAKPEA